MPGERPSDGLFLPQMHSADPIRKAPGLVRSCAGCVKHLVYALAVLALLACLTEIALRVYDSATGQITRRELYDRGMVCKSWFFHHSLKPSRSFAVKNPDSPERVRVVVNSLGLRGREPAIPKPAGTFRILCLGDDTTFAAQVPDSETFCARLQTELEARCGPSVEVVNAGIPDYCPLLSYLQVRHELLGLQPDLIVLNFDMSDVADDYQYRRHAVTSSGGVPVSCAHPALEMPRGKSPKESPLLLPQWGKQRLNAFLAEKSREENSRSIDSPRSRYLWLEDQPPDWSLYIGQALAPIGHLSELVEPLGAHLVVAACPAPWQVSPSASSGPGVRERAGVSVGAVYRSRRPCEALAEFCAGRRIVFCDPSDEFQRAAEPEGLFCENAAAFSAQGHALYARILAECLARDVPGLPRGESGAPSGAGGLSANARHGGR